MTVKYKYALVAVSGPLRRSFTYRVPAGFSEIKPGQRLLVPFGRSKKTGYFLGYTTSPKNIDLKDIHAIIDSDSFFSSELFEFCRWVADYYFANPADCFTAALPPLVRSRKSKSSKKLTGYQVIDSDRWDEYFSRKKIHPEMYEGIKSRSELKEHGWTDYHLRSAWKNGLIAPVYQDDTGSVLHFIEARKDVNSIELTPEQNDVLNELRKSPEKGFHPFLLHGVTGSGKTIIYCHLAREVIASGASVLLLTPEIALTGSVLAYLRGFFGDQVTVIHSSMTDRERQESWEGIRKGRYKIAIGPRSAVFAPLPNLGLIVVDEEHDSSYKQDDPAPRFHARDCAVMRASINNIPVLLGSASPSLESYYNASSGRYTLFNLTERPGQTKMPAVHIVDMRQERLKGDMSYLSYRLKKEVDQRLKKKEQVILYLNRRGYAPQLKCNNCGFVPECPHCRLKLTYHKVGRKLTCHYCGYVQHRYDSCQSCQSQEFFYRGVGTQKVEENLPRVFSDYRLMRFDSDTAFGRRKAYDILNTFARQDADILLGTQMVTKGLDLPNVTLVAVLAADMNIELPTFRASEQAFARLLQVSGRCGRADKPGEVLIQTFDPESDVIVRAAVGDYKTFYDHEIASRRSLLYPPFSHLVNFVFSGKNESRVEKAGHDFKDSLEKMLEKNNLKAQILGPAPCAFYRLRGQFRRHLFVKTKQVVKIGQMLTGWEQKQPRFGLPSSVRITVDIDPDDMM